MIEHTLRELLEDKVELDIEGIDRLYLNAYQPRLQTGGGVVSFFREHRGAQVACLDLRKSETILSIIFVVIPGLILSVTKSRA